MITYHNMSDTNLYWIWGSMIQRCHNKNNVGYKNYGARGIKVCDTWRYNAKEFLEWALENGYKKGLTIERLNNSKGYFPSNCLFVQRLLNNTNKRVYRVNKTGYAGVTPRRGKYRVRLRFNGKLYNIGTYKTLKKAVTKRNEFIIKNNFPHKIQEYRE